jgi:hypothetical protein
VAYYPVPQPQQRRRGRPRLYGHKVRLGGLWRTRQQRFQTAPSLLYGESRGMLRYYVIDLLWRPVGQWVRFILVDHPTRGRGILRRTDLTLTPLELIAGHDTAVTAQR